MPTELYKRSTTYGNSTTHLRVMFYESNKVIVFNCATVGPRGGRYPDSGFGFHQEEWEKLKTAIDKAFTP